MAKPKRSAKVLIEELATEILARENDLNSEIKLDLIGKIAFKMGWNDLFGRIHYRHEAKKGTDEKWFQK